MKRITASLPDDLADKIVRESRIRRKSVSEIVRKSLGKDFEVGDTTPRRVGFTARIGLTLIPNSIEPGPMPFGDTRTNEGRCHP